VTTPKDANGCPLCPTCTPGGSGSCTADSDCTHGFCYNGGCQSYSGVGGPCNGFILPPRRCEPGLYCKMSNIPDVGGTCQKSGGCPVCPHLACPLDQQVTASAEAAPAALSVSASLYCPPCPTCCVGHNCLPPCCPPVLQETFAPVNCRDCGFRG
jgi:hypothetical protein